MIRSGKKKMDVLGTNGKFGSPHKQQAPHLVCSHPRFQAGAIEEPDSFPVYEGKRFCSIGAAVEKTVRVQVGSANKAQFVEEAPENDMAALVSLEIIVDVDGAECDLGNGPAVPHELLVGQALRCVQGDCAHAVFGNELNDDIPRCTPLLHLRGDLVGAGETVELLNSGLDCRGIGVTVSHHGDYDPAVVLGLAPPFKVGISGTERKVKEVQLCRIGRWSGRFRHNGSRRGSHGDRYGCRGG